jgi:hypothetical protein
MAEGVAWTKRLRQIAKWALLGVIGLAIGLLAVFFGMGILWSTYVLVRLLGAEIGLWEFELSFG